jgi:hypothetical protein
MVAVANDVLQDQVRTLLFELINRRKARANPER